MTTSLTRAIPDGTDVVDLPARFLCTIDVDFHHAPVFGTAIGTRAVFAARNGTVSGPGINAEVLPGSADWLTVGSDLVARFDVRAVMRTDDGEHTSI